MNDNIKEIIGASDAIKKVKKSVSKIAKSDKNVIIKGQIGVGKSIVAENIHYKSARADKPVIKLNLISFDEDTINRVLKTVINKERFINPFLPGKGAVHLTSGSAFIIESLENTNFITQKFVYDVIREKSIYRFLFLVPEDYTELLNSYQFYQPLVEILKTYKTIHVPPLSERNDDIPLFVVHFINEASKEIGIKEPVIDSNALDVLCRYNWKGNIGQLKTVVQRSVLLSEGNETIYLPEELLDEQTELSRMIKSIEEGISTHIDTSLELIEKKLLLRVLEKFDNHQAMTARFLKISEETLRYRMKKYGIPTAQNK